MKPLHEAKEDLVRVATGQQPADLLITGVALANVCSGEIRQDSLIAIRHGRIAYAGPAMVGSLPIGIEARQTRVADGMVACPGFIDLHVHFESSQVPPSEYARAALSRGETTALPDCHEIGNVLGVRGVVWMRDNVAQTPLKVVMGVPSCVPATPFETAGAAIGPEEVEMLFTEERFGALAEMMNYPGVLACADEPMRKIAAALQAGAVVEGHISGQGWRELAGYFAAGVMTCHESLTTQDIVNRIRMGITTYARAGSGWDEITELAEALRTVPDHRNVCLVTDDRDPGDVLHKGTMDHVIRRAISEGIAPIAAIQMATINPATHLARIRVPGYEWVHEIGRLAPGYRADIALLSDLEAVAVEDTYVDGRSIREIEFPAPTVDGITGTVKLGLDVGPDDFAFRGDQVHLITIGEKLLTEHSIVSSDGGIAANPAEDLVKLACLERHKGTGEMTVCLLKGLGIKDGAVASTVAHDSHQLLVAGTNDEDMARAVAAIGEAGGGIVVVRGGEIIGMIELPGAGLIGDATLEEMAAASERQKDAWRAIGCTLEDPFMLFGLLGLTVLPHVRITPKGIFSVDRFEYIA
jgi:adenine deaminase